MPDTPDARARVRVPGLQVLFQPDARLLVRSMTHGVGARVPLPAIGVLAFCSEPRTPEEVEAAMGPTGRTLFDGLEQAGLLVDPAQVTGTPVFFENFAAVDVHRRMVGDAARVDAYWRALSAVVRPGMAVLDAGTGSGLLACMAAEAGARVVYAVDNSDLIDLARDVVAASGLSDRVHTIRADFAEVRLPEPVDVVVTETFGALALAEGATDDLRACVARNLAPGGVVIPGGIDLWLAPVGDRALFEETVGVFAPLHGADLAPLRRLALRRSRSLDLPAGALLGPAQRWAALQWPAEGEADAAVAFSDLPEGTLCGLVGWFTLRLAPGVDLPTGPLDPPTHWGQAYLPLQPVPVAAGDTLTLHATLRPSEEDRRSVRVEGRWTCGAASGVLDHHVR